MAAVHGGQATEAVDGGMGVFAQEREVGDVEQGHRLAHCAQHILKHKQCLWQTTRIG